MQSYICHEEKKQLQQASCRIKEAEMSFPGLLHLLPTLLPVHRLLFLLLLIILLPISSTSGRFADAFRFDVSAIAPKCLSEHIHAKSLVLAHYRAIVTSDENHGHEYGYASSSFSSSEHTVSLKVSSPYGKALHHAESVPGGEFSFMTVETGTYVVCFWLSPSSNVRSLTVDLDWKVGVAAKDWDSVARKDKIEGVELELMKVYGAVEMMHSNMLYLRERETEMRNLNEKTNALIAQFGIASLFICILAAGWQLWHIRSFFKKKKLI